MLGICVTSVLMIEEKLLGWLVCFISRVGAIFGVVNLGESYT
jgi:hypothetical protein